jgi:hypothetical protein
MLRRKAGTLLLIVAGLIPSAAARCARYVLYASNAECQEAVSCLGGNWVEFTTCAAAGASSPIAAGAQKSITATQVEERGCFGVGEASRL